jgi:hypothetical protein
MFSCLDIVNFCLSTTHTTRMVKQKKAQCVLGKGQLLLGFILILIWLYSALFPLSPRSAEVLLYLIYE